MVLNQTLLLTYCNGLDLLQASYATAGSVVPDWCLQQVCATKSKQAWVQCSTWLFSVVYVHWYTSLIMLKY